MAKTLLKVLFVCTGNICRSPSAEAVLRAKLIDHGMQGMIAVDSAGTDAYHTGEAPSNPAIVLGARRGYDLTSLRARQVVPDDFEHFDRIYCMTEKHQKRLQALCPTAFRERLLLFSSLAKSLPKNIPDPYYSGDEDYQKVFDYCELGCETLITDLKNKRLNN